MTDYRLAFELAEFHALDQFALLARQDYNLGDRRDWFGTFRGGLYGLYARLHGAATHYLIVHSWVPTLRSPTETEYHLASIFFNLDSAIECLTFALNALGGAVDPEGFRDVSDHKALRRISPVDILGTLTTTPPRPPLPGYDRIFPSLAKLWRERTGLIDQVVEQHDVSKHRQTIFVGGKCRMDPPRGFYEVLGIPDDPARRAMYCPMAEIILKEDPKAPPTGRSTQRVEDQVLLEGVAQAFVEFVRDSGNAALADARANIGLAETAFR